MIDPTIFFTASFLLCAFIIYKKVYKKILVFVDNYIASIKDTIYNDQQEIKTLQKQLKKESNQHLKLNKEIEKVLKIGTGKIEQMAEDIHKHHAQTIECKKNAANLTIIRTQNHMLHLLRCEISDIFIKKLDLALREKIKNEGAIAFQNIALLRLQQQTDIKKNSSG